MERKRQRHRKRMCVSDFSMHAFSLSRSSYLPSPPSLSLPLSSLNRRAPHAIRRRRRPLPIVRERAAGLHPCGVALRR